MKIKSILLLVFFGICMNAVGYASTNKIKKTQMTIGSIITSLHTFRLDVGRLPSTKEGLNSLVTNKLKIKSWDGPYTSTFGLKDAWGSQFVYENKNSKRDFIVYSKGPNGMDDKGKKDDVICSGACKY